VRIVAIDRNRVLRTNSPIPGRGGDRTRRNVVNASIINIKVMIIEVVIINRRFRGRVSSRFIITVGYLSSQDSLALSIRNRLS
jgi:hypothetical protein